MLCVPERPSCGSKNIECEFRRLANENPVLALAGVARLVRASFSLLKGCRFDPGCGVCRRQTDPYFSLPHPLLLSSFSEINRNIFLGED